MAQQGDVILFQTDDGGEITVEGGLVRMDGGLQTAAYLSLFGGSDWWANLTETVPERQYNSETEELLKSLPLTSSNLKRVEDAVTRDLAWMQGTGVASTITVEVSVPAVNRLSIVIDIDGGDIAFTANWRASV
jgi:phage gp46-like protein